MDEILTTKQRLKHVEEIKCTDKVKHLKNENNSKTTIMKILSESIYSDEWYI